MPTPIDPPRPPLSRRGLPAAASRLAVEGGDGEVEVVLGDELAASGDHVSSFCSFSSNFSAAAARFLSSLGRWMARWRGIRILLLSSKKGGVAANEWESTVFHSSEGGGNLTWFVIARRPSAILFLLWVVLLALGCRLRHGQSSGRAVFRLVQQFINLGSSPNNRQDLQHSSSSLASKSTTKEQRQQIFFLPFFTHYLHIIFSLMPLLSQIAPSSIDLSRKSVVDFQRLYSMLGGKELLLAAHHE